MSLADYQKVLFGQEHPEVIWMTVAVLRWTVAEWKRRNPEIVVRRDVKQFLKRIKKRDEGRMVMLTAKWIGWA